MQYDDTNETLEAGAGAPDGGASTLANDRCVSKLFGMELMTDSMLAGLEEAIARPEFFKTRTLSKQFFQAGYEGEHISLSSRPWSYAGQGTEAILFWPAESAANDDGPRVSEKICAAIFVLTKHRRYFLPATCAQAQRVLSEALIAHPVLMHPAINLTYCYDVGGPSPRPYPRVSVAQALGMSAYGRLPMPEDGFSDDQLREFYNHPCTKLALFGSIVARTKTTDPRRQEERMMPREHLTRSDRAIRAEFLASMHLAHTLTQIDKGMDPLFPVTLLASPDRYQFDSQAYAETFLQSCGLFGSPAYLEALHVFNAIGFHKDHGFWNEVFEQFRANLSRGGLGPRDIAELTQQLTDFIEGLHVVGLRETKALAATLVYQQLLGPGTTMYPKLDLTNAMALVGALVDHQVRVDYRHVPKIEAEWRQALEIHCKAQTMTATIESEVARVHSPRGSAAIGVAPVDHGALVPPAPSRRARIGV